MPNRIDLITAISGVTFDEAWERRVSGDMDGLPVQFIGLDDLIHNKESTNRGKDLGDAAELRRRRGGNAGQPTAPPNDDRGQFRFGQLSGETYFLKVSGTPWYAHAKPASYAPVCMLQPGEDASANLTLHTVPASTTRNRRDDDNSPDTIAPCLDFLRCPAQSAGGAQVRNRKARCGFA